MSIRKLQVLAVATCVFAAPASLAALTTYSQNFEGLNQADPGALAADGWLVGGNGFAPDGGYLYSYGPFYAPNDGAAFSSIDIGQGGPGQGAQQMVVYSDYGNPDQGNGRLIEAFVFQEQRIGAGDLGLTSVFSFDAKQGNIGGSTTALAFLKVLDLIGGSFTVLDEVTVDTTALGANWVEDITLSLAIDGSFEGQLLRFGFQNTASNNEPSGVFYDNINVAAVPIPAAAWLFGSALLGLVGVNRRKA